MNIELHIERLVLDGLPIGALDGEVVRAAVEAELTRLLAIDGLGMSWHAGGALPVLPVGDLALAIGDAPEHIGTRIAGVVYDGIGASDAEVR